MSKVTQGILITLAALILLVMVFLTIQVRTLAAQTNQEIVRQEIRDVGVEVRDIAGRLDAERRGQIQMLEAKVNVIEKKLWSEGE